MKIFAMLLFPVGKEKHVVFKDAIAEYLVG